MGKIWNEEISRRALLRIGMTSAAIAAVPWPGLRGVAHADPSNPHFLVTFYADGGWDPTQVLDVHDPNDPNDGIDVDVPTGVSGLPASQIASVGPITYISNPTTRPMVDTYFANHSGRSAIINGINTRSTSHDQSRQLVLTGYLDPTRADFAVMAAHKNGADLPLPHLLLSGPAFGGPFAGLSGRVGGQLGTALAYNRIPSHTDPVNQQQLTVSALGEGYIQQALEWQRILDGSAPAGALTGKFDQFTDAQKRGDKLAHLASSLPQNTNQGAQLATSLGQAFRQGLTTSVTFNNVGGFDTHSDNTQQNGPWNNIFTFLDSFLTGLATQPGLVNGSLLAETTVVYVSEFGRTPQLNGANGKDHHPWTSVLVAGKNVRPGVYGRTDSNQEGVKINLQTGAPDDTGVVLDVTNVVAGLVTLMGANSSDYLPASVKPITAMIA
jgi:uncharacterized protein (DUF1501 family)